ncbi:MAG: GNAT family N-acetyltransferase [Candidatus Micrarchaeota archaeon]|nr:GNAT family N-acetyltransferase [Candidatus Micrarchaeota archaeon]
MRISSGGSPVFLTGLAIEDADAVQRNADDAELARDVASTGSFPHPYTKADALEFIQRAVSLYPLMAELHMGVRRASDDALVGACALTAIDRVNLRAEIGYWIGREHWGRGYGKAAASLMVSYAFSQLGLKKVYCSAFDFNARSIALLGSLGFIEEGRLRRHDVVEGRRVDTLVFGVLDSEWGAPADVELSD